jgi:hypothetical protein
VWFNDAPAENPMKSSPDLERASGSDSAPDRPSKKMKWNPWNHDCPWKKNEEHRRNIIDFIKLLSKMHITPLESISVVTGSGIHNDFLGSLEAPCTISSIKLRGNLNKLPNSSMLNKLDRIKKKLQFFLTGLTQGQA